MAVKKTIIIPKSTTNLQPKPGSLSLADFLERYQEAAKRRFNSDQKTAVSHNEGPLFVMAGPGSGKSEVMVARCLKLVLVDGVAPQSVFLTTFTEKAARNLQDRVASRLASMGYIASLDDLRVGTLHSLCDRIMREFRYQAYAQTRLLDGTEQSFFVHSSLGKWIKDKNNLPDDFWTSFSFLTTRVSKEFGPNTWQKVGALVTLFNRVADEDVDLAKMRASKEPAFGHLVKAIEHYSAQLVAEHRCDFSGLQHHFRNFLETPSGQKFLAGDVDKQLPPLRHVLVDEYQDTNPIQEDLYFRLASACKGNITVVGDDDQALYRFRGGTVECIVRFTAKCKSALHMEATDVQLKINYRSVPEITKWAERILFHQAAMKKPGARTPKSPMLNERASIPGYPPVSLVKGTRYIDAGIDTAEVIRTLIHNKHVSDPSHIAVLFRSAKESPQNAGPLCEALRALKIPIYNPRSKAFLEAPEIQAMLGALIELIDQDAESESTILGPLKNSVAAWRAEFRNLAGIHSKLQKYVDDVHHERSKKTAGEWLSVSIRDLFFRVLSLPPFSDWREDPAKTFRLGQLSAILESFGSVERSESLRIDPKIAGKFSQPWVNSSFYYRLLGYLHQASLDDPEDVDHQIVPGCVQIMTVHQAKGLEFPVVIFCSPGVEPKHEDSTFQLEDMLMPFAKSPRSLASPHDRAMQDVVRFYYVAYTRAENALIIAGADAQLKRAAIALGQ